MLDLTPADQLHVSERGDNWLILSYLRWTCCFVTLGRQMKHVHGKTEEKMSPRMAETFCKVKSKHGHLFLYLHYFPHSHPILVQPKERSTLTHRDRICIVTDTHTFTHGTALCIISEPEGQ